MTEDLTPRKGRVFIGKPTPNSQPVLLVVKAARTRRDGTHSSCILVAEFPGVGNRPVFAEYSVRLPPDGLLHGYRRVTVSQVGIANEVAGNNGKTVPTDAVCIVTRDRTGGGPVFET